MSDDATYVVIRDAQAQFAYGRQGAASLFTDLLRGPEELLACILDELPRTEAPSLATSLQAYVCVDDDRRELLYWRSGGHDALTLRTHLELVRRQWPGWTCVWPQSPTRALAERLTAHAEAILALALDRPPASFDDFVDANSVFTDLLARRDTDTLALIDELGLAGAQRCLEADSCDAWLSLRRPDGAWEHQIFDDLGAGTDLGAGVSLGPAILPILERRPHGAVEFVWLGEDELKTGYLIDPVARTLDYWSTSVRLGGDYSVRFEAAWPGWSCRPLSPCAAEACAEHLRRVGLAPESLREGAALESLQQDIERWLAPLASGGAEPGARDKVDPLNRET